MPRAKPKPKVEPVSIYTPWPSKINPKAGEPPREARDDGLGEDA